MPRAPVRSRPERPAGGAAPIALLLTGMVALAGCSETEVMRPDPDPAVVAVVGQVTDPAAEGVEDAAITISLHETADCESPLLSEASGPSGSDGGFSALVGLNEAGEDFEPFEVCLDVRAEPPVGRPELGPAEETGLTGTLRRLDDGPPVDTLEVELTLPETGTG